MNYTEINKEIFYSLELDEQIKIINYGLKKEKTLQKVCDNMGIARKHVSEKFRKAGYVFSKVDKEFFKPEETQSIEELTKNKKETIVSNKTGQVTEKSPKLINNKCSKSREGVVNSFDFYYQPSGTSKKIGASVDADVLRQFEIVCSKFNFINTSAHVSNALALYIQKMNSK